MTTIGELKRDLLYKYNLIIENKGNFKQKWFFDINGNIEEVDYRNKDLNYTFSQAGLATITINIQNLQDLSEFKNVYQFRVLEEEKQEYPTETIDVISNNKTITTLKPFNTIIPSLDGRKEYEFILNKVSKYEFTDKGNQQKRKFIWSIKNLTSKESDTFGSEDAKTTLKDLKTGEYSIEVKAYELKDESTRIIAKSKFYVDNPDTIQENSLLITKGGALINKFTKENQTLIGTLNSSYSFEFIDINNKKDFYRWQIKEPNGKTNEELTNNNKISLDLQLAGVYELNIIKLNLEENIEEKVFAFKINSRLEGFGDNGGIILFNTENFFKNILDPNQEIIIKPKTNYKLIHEHPNQEINKNKNNLVSWSIDLPNQKPQYYEGKEINLYLEKEQEGEITYVLHNRETNEQIETRTYKLKVLGKKINAIEGNAKKYLPSKINGKTIIPFIHFKTGKIQGAIISQNQRINGEIGKQTTISLELRNPSNPNEERFSNNELNKIQTKWVLLNKFSGKASIKKRELKLIPNDLKETTIKVMAYENNKPLELISFKFQPILPSTRPKYFIPKAIITDPYNKDKVLVDSTNSPSQIRLPTVPNKIINLNTQIQDIRLTQNINQRFPTNYSVEWIITEIDSEKMRTLKGKNISLKPNQTTEIKALFKHPAQKGEIFNIIKIIIDPIKNKREIDFEVKPNKDIYELKDKQITINPLVWGATGYTLKVRALSYKFNNGTEYTQLKPKEKLKIDLNKIKIKKEGLQEILFTFQAIDNNGKRLSKIFTFSFMLWFGNLKKADESQKRTIVLDYLLKNYPDFLRNKYPTTPYREIITNPKNYKAPRIINEYIKEHISKKDLPFQEHIHDILPNFEMDLETYLKSQLEKYEEELKETRKDFLNVLKQKEPTGIEKAQSTNLIHQQTEDFKKAMKLFVNAFLGNKLERHEEYAQEGATHAKQALLDLMINYQLPKEQEKRINGLITIIDKYSNPNLLLTPQVKNYLKSIRKKFLPLI